jgi:pyruvate/2-oxoacid:ferredoxin oxidoreductase beta subunit
MTSRWWPTKEQEDDEKKKDKPVGTVGTLVVVNDDIPKQKKETQKSYMHKKNKYEQLDEADDWMKEEQRERVKRERDRLRGK